MNNQTPIHPYTEVWVVYNANGPDYVAYLRSMAMEHAADMAANFPELGPWKVFPYSLAEQPK